MNELTPDVGRADVLAILRTAREMIHDPKHWARGAFRAEGDAFCAAGAVINGSGHSGKTGFSPECCAALQVLADELESVGACIHVFMRFAGDHNAPRALDCVTAFNDTHTHAEVLSLFDSVLARLSEEIDDAG